MLCTSHSSAASVSGTAAVLPASSASSVSGSSASLRRSRAASVAAASLSSTSLLRVSTRSLYLDRALADESGTRPGGQRGGGRGRGEEGQQALGRLCYVWMTG